MTTHKIMLRFLFLTFLFLCPALAGWAQVDEDDEVVVYDSQLGAEEEIILPEGMNAAMDSLLHEWNSQRYLIQVGDCAFGENREYDKETYIRRLSRLPNVIEMPYNDVVRKFIDQYTGRLRQSVGIFLGTGNFYMPIFEEALEAYQLPLELKYLPIIESALNPMATSRAGAAGLWQFIITTGKLYGLEVTSLIDERRDPVKASYAAAHYLKDLYDIFGDWTLVIASYNCGPNNVRKAISRAGGVQDYWKIYPYLPAETRGYVPAFIAANYVMNYYREHNICPVGTALPATTDTIHVHRNLYFDQLVDLCDVGMDELRALNPQYRTTLIPGDSHACILRMPQMAMTRFTELGDSIYRYRVSELATNRREVEVQQSLSARASRGRGSRTVRVRSGDTLGAIARRNGTTVSRLRRLNGIRGSHIVAGQRLRVR